MASRMKIKLVKRNFVTTWLRDISSWPNEVGDKMHFVTSVCLESYVDRHEHISRSYTSKSKLQIFPNMRCSRTYLSRTSDASYKTDLQHQPYLWSPIKMNIFDNTLNLDLTYIVNCIQNKMIKDLKMFWRPRSKKYSRISSFCRLSWNAWMVPRLSF